MCDNALRGADDTIIGAEACRFSNQRDCKYYKRDDE